MQAADGSVEPLRDGVSGSLPAPPDHVAADDSVDSTGFFLTAPRVDTASQGVEAPSLVQQGQVAATPTNTPMAAAAAVLDGITGQPAASMDDAVAGDAEVSEGGAPAVSGDTAPAPCPPDVAAQPQPQEQPQPQPDEEPVGSAIYVDDGDGRFVNASGEAKAYDGSQPVLQSSVPPLQPGRSVDSAPGDEALAQGYFTPLSKDVSVGDDAGGAPQEEAGEPATPQAVTKGRPGPVARSPAVSPLPPEEGWATSPAGPGRPDRLRFDRSGLLVQPNRRLWTTGPVQLWTPEPKHDESNITFVDDETKMPSYIQAIQARKAKLNARLAKASGWNKAPKIAPRSKSSPALRKSVTLPPAKGSRRLSESHDTAATAGDAAGPAVGDGGDDTAAWQGAASRNLSSQRRRRRGPLAAQFAVQSRVLGSWAEQERAELRRREKEIRTEQSIRRQRRLQAELERFKANMQPVQPASVPPLSHATLLFWSKHPELNPLRYERFDPLAEPVSLQPEVLVSTKTVPKKGNSKEVEVVPVRHDIHDKANVTLTVPVHHAMRSTHRASKGVTRAASRVAPPLPPARLPPVLHAALEQYIDEQVAVTGSRQWRDSVAGDMQNAVDSLWLSQKVHAVVVPVQAAARRFVQRCRWYRITNAAIDIHRMGRGFLARRFVKKAAAFRIRVVREVVMHDMLAAVCFAVMRDNIQSCRQKLTCTRVLRAWAHHTKKLRVCARLFGFKTKGAQRKWFRAWAGHAAEQARFRRISDDIRRRRYVALQRRCFSAWAPYALRACRVKRMIKRYLGGVQRTVFHMWVDEIAQRKRAAARLVAMYRGHNYRRRAAAAKEIQRIVRGHLGRCKAKREHAHMLYDAAMALQAITRGFVDRLYAKRQRRRVHEREVRRQLLEEEAVDRAEVVAREEALLFLKTKAGKAMVKEETKRLEDLVVARRDAELEDARRRAKLRAQGVALESKASEDVLSDDLTQRVELKVYFGLFDLDGGGTIDRNELGALVRGALERPLSNRQLDDLMARLDADGSGAVEFAEFAQWWLTDVVAKRKKRNGLMRGFMRAKRFVQKKLGQSGMALAAKQVVISRMQMEARTRRRVEFRRELPPPHACSTCLRAFALYGDLARHKCASVKQQQQDERIQRQASRRHINLRKLAGSKAQKDMPEVAALKPAKPVYGTIRGQDLDTHLYHAPEDYESKRDELVGSTNFDELQPTKASRRARARQLHDEVSARYRQEDMERALAKARQEEQRRAKEEAERAALAEAQARRKAKRKAKRSKGRRRGSQQ